MIVVNARFLTQKLTGVQRFAYEISVQLKKKLKNDVLFVSPSNIRQHEIANSLGVIIIGKMTGYAWEQIELPIYLKKLGSPKLLCLCSVAPLWYNNTYLAIHDITWVRYPETFSKSFRIVYNFLVPKLCYKAKRLITVSNFSKDEIASRYKIPQEKFIVVYNAVDKSFHPVNDDDLKKENYFLAVSSVKANKNFSSILEAFVKFQELKTGYKLFIVGDCKSSTFKTIDIDSYKDNRYIDFIGRVSDSDLVRYYSNALGFIFPSLYEGFGIPVLEAQACGCPVLSSNIPPLREVLGNSALFCAPLDLESMTEKMLAMTEMKDQLIKKGFDNISRFSWEESANKIINLMNE